MPYCTNCGGHVTERYARVMAKPDEDPVDCCPGCPDKVRDGTEIRDARSSRSGNRVPTDGDTA